MSTTFNGTLTLTIADAKNLISEDYGRQDPYVKISLGSKGYKKFLEGDSWGNETFTTKTHEQGGKFPVWNETHTLNITNMQLDTRLLIALYDRDRFKDDYIGCTRLTLGELLQNQGVKYYYDLTSKPYKPQVAGSIGLMAKFNCTEIPRTIGTLTDQIKDMHRRNQDKKVGQGPILKSQIGGPRPQTQGVATATASSLRTHQGQSGLESGVQQVGTSGTGVQSGTSGTTYGTGTSGTGTSGTGTGTYCTYSGCQSGISGTQSGVSQGTGLESGVQQATGTSGTYSGVQSGQGYTGSGQGYTGQGYTGSGVQSGSYTNPLSTGQSSDLQSGQPIPSNVPPTSSLPSGVSGVSGVQSGYNRTGQYDDTYKGQSSYQGDTYNKGQSVYQGQPIHGQPIQGQYVDQTGYKTQPVQGQYVDQTGNSGIYQGQGTSQLPTNYQQRS